MADQLFLSIWFPNFRLQALPGALVSVLRQFALVSKEGRVTAVTVYPLRFTEAPLYQRIFSHKHDAIVLDGSGVMDATGADPGDAAIENAVAEATEQLHDDMAYEFEMRWNLWSPDLTDGEDGLETTWVLKPAIVRILGFGPEFDDASFDQNGHIRVDFGLDIPWVLEDTRLDPAAARSIQANVEMLLAFTLSVEKHCGISSRLLWTESGEPLAEKLIATLQRLN